MKKMNKQVEMNCKSIGAAMFMATICLYMIAGGMLALATNERFYYHIPFGFLVQGIAVSLIISFVWAILFSFEKSWNFVTRYLLFLIILAALSGASILIPAINSNSSCFLWIISGFLAVVGMGTVFSVKSEKHFRSIGERNVLAWELLK